MISIEVKQKIKRFCAKIERTIGHNHRPRLSVILNYHSIHPTNTYSVRPNDFLQQIEYLISNFSVVSLPDFYKMRATGQRLPDKLAMVTFDDGYADNYMYAFPVLHQFGIKATIFVTTGFINHEVDITRNNCAYSGLRPLEWTQIIEMKDTGLFFGAHTHTHQVLSYISLEKAKKEIVTSRQILEQKLKQSIDMFAYPLGQRRTFTRPIIEFLKMQDFKLCCSTIWGSDNSEINMFALHRIRIDAADTFEDFKAKIHGYWDFIRWFQFLRGQ